MLYPNKNFIFSCGHCSCAPVPFYFNLILFVQTGHANFDFNWCLILTGSCFSLWKRFEWSVWLNCWVFANKLRGCGFESNCSHLKLLLLRFLPHDRKNLLSKISDSPSTGRNLPLPLNAIWKTLPWGKSKENIGKQLKFYCNKNSCY